MANELIAWLVEATVAGSAAIAVVLLLRRPVRRVFGAGAAYAAWALVPAVLLASLLPAAAEPMAPRMAAVVSAGVSGLPALAATPAFDPRAWLVPLWGLGFVLSLATMVGQQRRFLRRLGPLRPRADGLLDSAAVAGLPAVIGWRASIVLPGDFEQRYTARERRLVLCHEQVHRRRGDLYAGALVAALRCLFWFNPLVHVAAGRFRQDQELACDAAVLQRFPADRRAYGDAMLKTQLAGQPLPLGCHWFGTHPIKERLTMLKRPLFSARRRFAGLGLVALLALAAAAVAWAAQPGGVADVPPGKLLLQMDIKVDASEARRVSAVLTPGVAHAEDFEHAGQAWATSWTVQPLADGTFDIRSVIRRDGEVVGEPRMIARDKAAIGIGDQMPDGGFRGIEIEMTLSLGPPAPGTAAVGIRGEVPAYPDAADAAGEGGLVMLKVRVGTDGKAREVQFVAEESTVAADSEFARSTIEVARQWTFNPGMKDGKPVEGWVMVPVRFEPKAPAAGGA